MLKVIGGEEEVKRLDGNHIQGAEEILNGFKVKRLGTEIKKEQIILGASEMTEQGSAQIVQ